MKKNNHGLFHMLSPDGKNPEGDWCSFPIPKNMVVGSNTVIDSSFIFKKFFSELSLGLKIGNNVTLQSPSLAAEKDGYIEIGDYCYITGASIIAIQKIIIGRHVYIAGGVTIVDSDFHPMDPGDRLTDTIAISTIGDKSRRPLFESSPVTIEDNVWIGYNATILKGVTIGRDSIIQPGAVVLKNVPPKSIVSGNPAVAKPYEHA